MELKIFRDALPAAGASCTLKAELPLETEILISDYLPPVFKLVKCFVRPVVLQKQLQPLYSFTGISTLQIALAWQCWESSCIECCTILLADDPDNIGIIAQFFRIEVAGVVSGTAVSHVQFTILQISC